MIIHAMTYHTAFDIARVALRDAESLGMRFKPGAVRECALALRDSYGIDEAKIALRMMMEAMRIKINPNWDGSIA